jgi:hypothetical protein
VGAAPLAGVEPLHPVLTQILTGEAFGKESLIALENLCPKAPFLQIESLRHKIRQNPCDF